MLIERYQKYKLTSKKGEQISFSKKISLFVSEQVQGLLKFDQGKWWSSPAKKNGVKIPPRKQKGIIFDWLNHDEIQPVLNKIPGEVDYTS